MILHQPEEPGDAALFLQNCRAGSRQYFRLLKLLRLQNRQDTFRSLFL